MAALPEEQMYSLQETITSKKTDESSDIKLTDVLTIADQILSSFKNANMKLDETLANELRSIQQKIDDTKSGLDGLQPFDQARVPDAGKELDEIVKSTEEATNQVMQQAEIILAADTTDIDAYKDKVSSAVMQIFESCSFQDITGQRINKVIKTLSYVEERVGSIIDVLGLPQPEAIEDKEEDSQAALLNGPALEGEGVKQDEVDAIFEATSTD